MAQEQDTKVATIITRLDEMQETIRAQALFIDSNKERIEHQLKLTLQYKSKIDSYTKLMLSDQDQTGAVLEQFAARLEQQEEAVANVNNIQVNLEKVDESHSVQIEELGGQNLHDQLKSNNALSNAVMSPGRQIEELDAQSQLISEILKENQTTNQPSAQNGK